MKMDYEHYKLTILGMGQISGGERTYLCGDRCALLPEPYHLFIHAAHSFLVYQAEETPASDAAAAGGFTHSSGCTQRSGDRSSQRVIHWKTRFWRRERT